MDLISRQAAIDALEKVAELYPWRVPGDRDSYSQYNEAWQDALIRADSEIKALPSAQPEEAILVAWLEEQAKWFESMDNAFAKIEASNIRVMIKKWRLK